MKWIYYECYENNVKKLLWNESIMNIMKILLWNIFIIYA